MAKDVKNQDDLDDRIGPVEPIKFYLTSPTSFPLIRIVQPRYSVGAGLIWTIAF